MKRNFILLSVLISFFLFSGIIKVKAEDVTCNLDDNIANPLACEKLIITSTNNLNNLNKFSNVQELEIAYLDLNDITFVNNFNNLKKLIINGSKINLKGFSSNIKTLNIYNSYLKNWNYLKYARNLENLLIGDTSYFRSLDFLQYTPNLKSLSINFPAYTNVNLTPILNLKDLEVLDLWGLEQNLNRNIISFLRRNNVKTSFTLDKDYEALYKQATKIYRSLNLDGLSDEEQIQKIILYVIDNLDYDTTLTGPAGQEAFKTEIMLDRAINLKSGVCRQYTILTNVLLEMAGFNAIQVRSNTLENHIWNCIYLNGSWYAIDPTWLDNAEGREKVVNNIRDTYYLVDPYGTFQDDHHPLSNVLTSMTPEFKITFDTQGGDYIAPRLVTGTNYMLPAPEKGNSFFDGWYEDEKLVNDFNTANLNKDITLYAGYNDSLRVEQAGNLPNPPTSIKTYTMIILSLVTISLIYFKLRKHRKFIKI